MLNQFILFLYLINQIYFYLPVSIKKILKNPRQLIFANIYFIKFLATVFIFILAYRTDFFEWKFSVKQLIKLEKPNFVTLSFIKLFFYEL